MIHRISSVLLSGFLLCGCRSPEAPQEPAHEGGSVGFEGEAEHIPDAAPTERLVVRSDADVLGTTNPKTVTWLILEGPGVTDAAMGHLSEFSEITRLTLRSTNVTDAGLVHLVALSRLGKLKLSGNGGLTGAGMASLARLGALYWLDFESQVLTVDSLASLGKMPRLRRLHLAFREEIPPALPTLSQFPGLERLYIQSPRLKDGDLRALEGPSRVSVLDFSGSPIGGEGLRFLSGFTALSELYLRHTGIHDAGLAHLPQLSRLRVLDLHGTSVGDAGIAKIDACRSMRNLYLGETRVSQSAASELEVRCPEVEIHRSGGSPRGKMP